MNACPTLPAAPVTRMRFDAAAAISEVLRLAAFRSNTRSTITAARITPPATTFCHSDADEVHGVEGHLHDAGADEHAEHRALAALQRAAAQHGRRDRVQLVRVSERRRRRRQVGDIEDAGHAREAGADATNVTSRTARTGTPDRRAASAFDPIA